MLQKWKRKGKRFRHVEKDGEETTELFCENTGGKIS